MPDTAPLEFAYRNHRGDVARRKVLDAILCYAKSEFHGGALAWYLRAFDIDRQAYRDFKLTDIEAFHEPGEEIGSGYSGDVRPS